MSEVICTTDEDVRTNGTVTFWRLSGSINLTQLVEEWDDRGWDGDLLPSTTGEAVALRRAVAELYQHRGTLVRPFQRGKVAVMDLTTEEIENHIQPMYTTRFIVWLDEDGIPVTHPPLHTEERARLLKQFQLVMDRLDEELSGWFASIVFKLKGVALRESGGVYFVPRAEETSSFTWDAFAEMIERLSYCRIHRIPAMSTESATRAVLDSLIEEVTKAQEAMGAMLDEKKFGIRALKTRTDRLNELFSKVSSYEALFGSSLDALRDGLLSLEARLVEATLVAEREEEV
jgi:hypothetical protein